MKRFNLHWSMRWGIRVFYTLVILALVGYAGTGMFLRSNLARETLVKKLSDIAGRPVYIGVVSLDWLRGFHVVLKDVRIPSEKKDAPPWLVCRNIVMTIRVLPLVIRRELIFGQLKVEDGAIRIMRDRGGIWKGVFPVPVEPSPEEPRIVSPKREKGRVTLLFPKVIIRRVSADISVETGKGTKKIKIFLNKGQTSFRKKHFRGEAEGTFQLSRHLRQTSFYARMSYTLTGDAPLKASTTISGLSLSDLGTVLGREMGGKVSGMSEISLSVGGSIHRSLTFQGRVSVHHLRFKMSRFEVDALINREMSFRFQGGCDVKAERVLNPYVTVEASSLQVLLQGGEGDRRKQAFFQKQVLFKGLVLKGGYESARKRIRLLLTSLYGLGKEATGTPGKIQLRGHLNTKEKKGFEVAFAITRLPLHAIFSPRHSEQEAISILRENKGIPLRELPLRILDRVEGEIGGNLKGRATSISAARLSAKWKSSLLSIRVSPFVLEGRSPLRLEISATKIPVTLAKDTPYILNRFPAKVKKWCIAFQSGRISLDKGKLDIERTATGALKEFHVREGDVNLSGISVVLPGAGILVEGFWGRLVYRAPDIKVLNLRCSLDKVCHLAVTKAEISDPFRRPIQIRCDGTIESEGMGFKQDGDWSSLSGIISRQLVKRVPFIPGYFEGKVVLHFDGTLAPFSFRDYKITLTGVKLKARMKEPWPLHGKSLTLLASLDAQPGKIDVKRATIVSPMGGLVSEGSVVTDGRGGIALNMSCKGQVSIKEGDLQAFVPQADDVQLSGIAPFFLKAQGVWPELFVEGHVEGTGLSYGFRNIFKKEKDVKSAVDFQVNQAGSQAFKINWIRVAAGQFVLKIWGKIVSLFPLRGEVMCQTSNQRFSSVLPLFPRFCSDPRCLMAKGEIQCMGEIDFRKQPVYNVKADLHDISVPFPEAEGPVKVQKASVTFGSEKRSIDVWSIRYKSSIGKHISLSGIFREGQWIWTSGMEFGTLNLDDFIKIFRRRRRSSVQAHERMDPFALAIRLLHDRYMKGFISVDQLRVINVQVQDLFARFSQWGRHGEIKGFNFLVPDGYGAVDVFWKETGEGKIDLKVLPLAKNLDFGKILNGLLHRDPPFAGSLSFHGRLVGNGGTYNEFKRNLNGHMVAKFEDGVIKKWSVLSNIFRLLDVYDILLLKFPNIKKGLVYEKIEGSIDVKNGVAKTKDAYLESRPFYMAGEGNLNLKNGVLSLFVGVYPFKLIDTFISRIPLIGRIFTNKDKKLVGYYFEIKGPVKNPQVRSVNAEKWGKRVWDTFKKIISLPFYPFQNHSEKGGKE